MVILSGMPIDSTSWNTLKVDDIEPLTKDIFTRGIPDGVILILISYKPDKRTKFFKDFPKENMKEFPLLDERGIKSFIKEKSDSLWVKLWNPEIEALSEYIGSDQFRIESELDKLSEYQKVHPEMQYTVQNLKEFLYLTPEQNNFDFFDIMLEDQKKAYKYLENMQSEWANRAQMIGFFHRGIKNFILLADAYEKGVKDSKILASELKIHPFVLKKNLSKMKTLLEKKSYITNFLHGLISIESDIKKGKLSEENFWLRIKQLLFVK